MQGVSRPSLDSYKTLFTGLYNAIYAVGHHQYSLKVTIKLLNSFLCESYEVMVTVTLLKSS